MELRTKLDYARELGVKKIRKAEKVASELRIKFAMSNGSQILDSLPMPNENSMYSDWGEKSPGTGGPPDFGRGGNSPLSRGRSNRKHSHQSVSSSVSSIGGAPKEPTMDRVLEKIRLQEGRKPDWTEERIKTLVNPPRKSSPTGSKRK